MASATAAAVANQKLEEKERLSESGHHGKENVEVTREEVARRQSGDDDECAAAIRRRSVENGGSAGNQVEQSEDGGKKLERAQSASSKRRGRLGVVRSLESNVAPTSGLNPAQTKPSQLFSLRQLALSSRQQLTKKRPSIQAEATGARHSTSSSGTFARLLELASSSQESQSSSGSSAENSSASDERRGRPHRRSEPGWSGSAAGPSNGHQDEKAKDEEEEEDDYEGDSEDNYEDDEEEDELSGDDAGEWAEEDEADGEQEQEAAGKTQVLRRDQRRRRRLRQRRSSGCPCEPVASMIGRDGLPVTDVDLASYKDLCQLAQARHIRTCQRRTGPQYLDPTQSLPASFQAAIARRSSLQEESGAYYQLCTSQEEQAIRARYLWFPPALKQLRQVELFFANFAHDKVPAVMAPAPTRDSSPKEGSSSGSEAGKVPAEGQTKNPAGAYRDEQISFQLPQQDMALDYCSYPMDEAARRAYSQFVDKRNSQALDVASVVEVAAASTTNSQHHSGQRKASQATLGANSAGLHQQRCRRCLVRLEPGQLAVVAPNFVIGSALYRALAIPEVDQDEGVATLAAAASPRPPLAHHTALFHPTCFTCSTCKEFLVDLVYCLRDNKLYCLRHYGESLRPRCALCQELIFSDEYLKAMNESFHVDHFLCRHCDSNLAGQRYVLKDEKPFCIRCYESNFANTCESCRKIIGVDSRDLSYKERHWHDACFVCNKCHQPLIDKPFGSKADKVYCADCYDVTFAARCDGCKNPFRSGSKKMEYKGRQWHDSCFCCCICLNTIGSNSFIPKNDEIYCIKCYENKYATRCTKCKQVIVSGGVTFRNEPWHRECFNCCNCNKSLAGQRFTTRDVANETVKNTNRTNQPHNAYCIDCYGDLFAKRCYACSQAITGLGGTRFVTFEDRSWHNSCFICNDCQVSLVGKGFITDGPDSIVCGECARAKLR